MTGWFLFAFGGVRPLVGWDYANWWLGGGLVCSWRARHVSTSNCEAHPHAAVLGVVGCAAGCGAGSSSHLPPLQQHHATLRCPTGFSASLIGYLTQNFVRPFVASFGSKCRLLAENDQLKTRLARAGLGEPVAAGGFSKKDE